MTAMQITVESSSDERCLLRYTASAEELDEYAEKAYRQNRYLYKIDGYDNGHAPRAAIEAARGKQTFWADAVDTALDELYPKAAAPVLAANGLRPLCNPLFGLDTISEQGYSGTAEYALLPEVKLTRTDGFTASAEAAPVQDAQLAMLLEGLREKHAKAEPLEGPASRGDMLVIRYHGMINDKPFNNGSSESYKMVLGKNQPFPEFYENLINHSKGFKCAILVTFPFYMADEELNGRTAVFDVEILETYRLVKPAFGDDLAKECGLASLDALRAELRNKLAAKAEAEALASARRRLLAEFSTSASCPIPEDFIEARMEDLYLKFKQNCVVQRISAKAMLKRLNKTEEQYKAILLEQAKLQLQGTAALVRLAEALHLSPAALSKEYDDLWPLDGLSKKDTALANAAILFLCQGASVQKGA